MTFIITNDMFYYVVECLYFKTHEFNMLTYMKWLLMLVKMVQLSPLTEEGMRRN